MEAYTNMKIEMENNEIAVKAAEEAKAAIMKDSLSLILWHVNGMRSNRLNLWLQT